MINESWDELNTRNVGAKPLQDVPAESERRKATYADIWWRLRGRKLHHVAPDVSRLVPGGCGSERDMETNRTRVGKTNKNKNIKYK